MKHLKNANDDYPAGHNRLGHHPTVAATVDYQPGQPTVVYPLFALASFHLARFSPFSVYYVEKYAIYATSFL
jgi:hypothetical protein